MITTEQLGSQLWLFKLYQLGLIDRDNFLARTSELIEDYKSFLEGWYSG